MNIYICVYKRGIQLEMFTITKSGATATGSESGTAGCVIKITKPNNGGILYGCTNRVRNLDSEHCPRYDLSYPSTFNTTLHHYTNNYLDFSLKYII